MYFNQFLGAACTQKLVKILFFSRFQAFTFWPALKSNLKHSFFQTLLKVFFLISGKKSLQIVNNEERRLKTNEKIIFTGFQVRAAPENWSKYTTCNIYNSILPLEIHHLNECFYRDRACLKSNHFFKGFQLYRVQ